MKSDRDDKNSPREVGIEGEVRAAAFLQSLGYRLKARNWRSPRWGEIDIVAEDRDCLVFVEVKTRTEPALVKPFEAVNFYKLKTLKRAALYYQTEVSRLDGPARIDVVSVTLGKKVNIEHFKNVYEDKIG